MLRTHHTRAAPAGPPRYQFRMADLTLWVAGIAAVAAVARGVRVQPYSPAHPIIYQIVQDVAAAGLAVFLGLVLVRQATRIGLRNDRDAIPIPMAVAWRLGAAVLLGLFAVAETSLLHIDHEGRSIYDYLDWHSPKMEILANGAVLGMVGVVLGLSAGHPRLRSPGREWLPVAFSAAVGALLAAVYCDIYFVNWLVHSGPRLDRMEHPDLANLARPGLHDRVIRAGLEFIPALAACLFSGVVISRELRRPAQPLARGSSRVRGLLLVLAAVTPAAGGGWLLWSAISSLDESLVRGFWITFRPPHVLAAGLGLAALAVGIAARAADRPGGEEPRPVASRPSRSLFGLLGRAAVVLVLLDFIASRVVDAAGRRGIHEWPWLGWTDAAIAWLWPHLPRAFTRDIWSIIGPSFLPFRLAEAWLAWRILHLMATTDRPEIAPIDASLGEPAACRRLALRSVMLTILMIAALPTFLLWGVVLVGFLYGVIG